MPKLLLEYKGVPAIIDHNLTSVNETIFIVVYKSKNNVYHRKDFSIFYEALEFEYDN